MSARYQSRWGGGKIRKEGLCSRASHVLPQRVRNRPFSTAWAARAMSVTPKAMAKCLRLMEAEGVLVSFEVAVIECHKLWVFRDQDEWVDSLQRQLYEISHC